MLALILAGGKGTRLQMGEKGLVRLCEKPLISYVIDTLILSGFDPVVLTTSYTPYTTNYCRALGIPWICTSGLGYIEDIIEAVSILEDLGPILTICADIPGITKEHLDYIITEYEKGGADACSVWVPIAVNGKISNNHQYIQNISGKPVFPIGINILLGEKISKEQDEIQIIINDPLLTYNINTRKELDEAECFFAQKVKNHNKR